MFNIYSNSPLILCVCGFVNVLAYINYICLPLTCELSDSEYYRERDLTVAGWGLTSESKKLLVVKRTLNLVFKITFQAIVSTFE